MKPARATATTAGIRCQHRAQLVAATLGSVVVPVGRRRGSDVIVGCPSDSPGSGPKGDGRWAEVGGDREARPTRADGRAQAGSTGSPGRVTPCSDAQAGRGINPSRSPAPPGRSPLRAASSPWSMRSPTAGSRLVPHSLANTIATGHRRDPGRWGPHRWPPDSSGAQSSRDSCPWGGHCCICFLGRRLL